MKGLFIDFETNGLDTVKDEITEVGFLVADIENKIPLFFSSFLVKFEKPIPENIITLTGINFGMYRQIAYTKELTRTILSDVLRTVDFCVAHNAEFEKGFIKTLFENCLADATEDLHKSVLTNDFEAFKKTHWIDTRYDLPLKANCPARNLEGITFKHNFINYFQHRALFDALSMYQVFCEYDFETIYARSKAPLITIIAEVTVEQKDLAKKAGFSWIPERKSWELIIKECDFSRTNFPFLCTIKRV